MVKRDYERKVNFLSNKMIKENIKAIFFNKLGVKDFY
jgi:hypothetical protein